VCFQPSVARAAVGYSSTRKLRISKTCFINMSALSHGKGVMPAVFDFSVQGNIGRIRTENGFLLCSNRAERNKPRENRRFQGSGLLTCQFTMLLEIGRQ
jgi:hypothetical protein